MYISSCRYLYSYDGIKLNMTPDLQIFSAKSLNLGLTLLIQAGKFYTVFLLYHIMPVNANQSQRWHGPTHSCISVQIFLWHSQCATCYYILHLHPIFVLIYPFLSRFVRSVQLGNFLIHVYIMYKRINKTGLHKKSRFYNVEDRKRESSEEFEKPFSLRRFSVCWFAWWNKARTMLRICRQIITIGLNASCKK